MSETLLDRLLEAMLHRRQLSCRARYEGAVQRLPDARRNIRQGKTATLLESNLRVLNQVEWHQRPSAGSGFAMV